MLVRRREVILSSIAAMSYGVSRAFAVEQCPADGLPPGTCSAYLDPAQFQSQEVAHPQDKSQWCWAACISMICKWHGHRLAQESIVKQIRGNVADLPAGDKELTEALNREFVTDSGGKIRLSSQIFSPALRTSDVLNARVVDDLKNGRPLLNGSGTHATVTARVDYRPNPGGQPQILRVHVIDPWPTATNNVQRARFLDGQEMTAVQLGGSLRYLASIRIVSV